MAQWTNENPGAGDLDSLREARKWFASSSEASDNAHAVLHRVFQSLPTVWTGECATAFRDAILARITDLQDLKEVTDTVASVYRTHIDEVEEIQESAKRHIADRDAALQVMGIEYMDSTTNPPSAAEIESRQVIYAQAKRDYDEAVSQLDGLAERRRIAEADFTRRMLVCVSSMWGEAKGAVARSGTTDTKHAGIAATWLQIGKFISGKGSREQILTDGNPFTEALRTSEHVNAVRRGIRKKLRAGTLHPGDSGFGNRKVSDNPAVFIGDGLNVLSGGELGNLPETALGSYTLDYDVNSIDENGDAQVTFTITNPMTRDSFTRNPLGGSFPWAPYFDRLNEEDGTWADMNQTIVWTETIERPR